jgi:transcriptional regulator with XRE-family HTH domain
MKPTFAATLSRLMANITPTQLAASAGVSRPYLYALASGRKQPTISVAQRLAKALGIPVCELCGQPCKR